MMYLEVDSEQRAKDISKALFNCVCAYPDNISRYLIGWTQDIHGAWFLQWDQDTDFRPVTGLSSIIYMLGCEPNAEVTTLADLNVQGLDIIIEQDYT